LTFTNGAGVFNLYQDDDLAPEGGKYVYFPSSEVYTYELEFDQALEWDTADAVSDDWVGVMLEIQGKPYTITDIAEGTTDVIDEITLVAGDSTVWLVQDQPYTVGSHTVTVVDVSDSDPLSCGVNVDGTTAWIDKDSTREISGMSVGVLDVKAVHSKDYDQDTCELSIGSSEIVLKDGDVVSVNGEDIDGSEVTFTAGVGTWTGFSITFDVGDAEEGVNSDDVYIAEGGAWTDPVFGNFKVVYSGVTGDFEEMSFDASSEQAEFEFTDVEGNKVKIPFFYDIDNEDVIAAGESDEAFLLMAGQDLDGVNGNDALDPEGTLLWYVTDGEVRILELADVEDTTGANANTTTIKDWMTGDTLADDADFTPGTPTVISLGSLGSVNLTITATNVSFHASHGYGTAETKGEGQITFGPGNVTLTEVDGDEVAESVLRFGLLWDTDDEELQLQNPDVTVGTEVQVDKSEDDSDNQLLVTPRGSWVEWNSDTSSSVSIMYPEETAYANVFVAPLDAEVSGGGSSGSVTADKVNPFAVGLAVLDEDAGSMTKNMIVVGGPCVNTVAAEVMGNPTNCAEGFEAGKAMLKFFDRKGKAALLVAGYDAQDSLNAAYVLAQHGGKYKAQFATLGDEVELVVTDMEKVVFNTA
jgi:hypothetical protein